ncbi:MAG: UbiD family decarboxylase [Deltaproteobacteria bacterium]|nr:UbiD family decarboxylase [Deltaproteobacteria bacterium]
MPFEDLRAFLAHLEKTGELVRVPVEVDPRFEIGAICRKTLAEGGADGNPTLFFEQVRGTRVPVVANVLTAPRRYYMALETTPETFRTEYFRRCAHPIPAETVRDAPCQEVVCMGPDVDLMRLPIPTWNAGDGGPYITIPSVIMRRPGTHEHNTGTYRMQVYGPNRVGIYAAPYREIARAAIAAHRRGEAFPVALAIGVDPAVLIATIAPFAPGVDEFAMAGALRGAPVHLVECLTQPVSVPAAAEIVLEGEFRPGDEALEGPFGEFTGYYGEARPRPVITITAMTHRRDPIFHGEYEGRPPTCESVTQIIPHEAEILRLVTLPGLKDIYMPLGGAMFLAIAVIEKAYAGHERALALAILATPSGRWIKTLILVDADINPRNSTEVEWALGTRFQPAHGIQVLHDMTGVYLDPSLDEAEKQSYASRTGKLIIDATKPVHRPFAKECLPPQEVLEAVAARWEQYGLGRGMSRPKGSTS